MIATVKAAQHVAMTALRIDLGTKAVETAQCLDQQPDSDPARALALIGAGLAGPAGSGDVEMYPRRVAHESAQKSAGGTFTAAQYRDATGVGRGLAIEILEFLDTLAITQRVGDARKLRKDYAAVLGPAEPLKPPAKSQSNPTADKRR